MDTLKLLQAHDRQLILLHEQQEMLELRLKKLQENVEALRKEVEKR